MTSRKYEPGHPQYGSVAFVTTETDLTYQTKWSREGWFDELQRFWDGFSGTGVLTEHPHTVGAILVPLKYHITYG